jgi:hypothetical protein
MKTGQKIKYINIDSRFYEEYSIDRLEYTIRVPYEIRDVQSITISCIEIPIVFHNISQLLQNNEFQIVVSRVQEPTVSVFKILVPNGYYTPPAIVDMISRLLCSRPETQDLEIRLNASNLIEFVSTSSEVSYEVRFDCTRSPFVWSKHLGKILGFRNPVYSLENCNASTNRVVIADTICDFTHPQYLFLEIYENEHENRYVFLSSLVGEQITKHAIARIAVDQHTFPYGSMLTANIFNGLLLSDTRVYQKPISLRKFYIRIVNEFGIPLDTHGFSFSFCITATIQEPFS